jgi:hypothetical protein
VRIPPGHAGRQLSRGVWTLIYLGQPDIYSQEPKHDPKIHSGTHTIAASAHDGLVVGRPPLLPRTHGLSLSRGCVGPVSSIGTENWNRDCYAAQSSDFLGSRSGRSFPFRIDSFRGPCPLPLPNEGGWSVRLIGPARLAHDQPGCEDEASWRNRRICDPIEHRAQCDDSDLAAGLVHRRQRDR